MKGLYAILVLALVVLLGWGLTIALKPDPLPVQAFASGEAVKVRVDGRKGVIIGVVNPRVPTYEVRLHSYVIGYRVITFRESELSKASP